MKSIYREFELQLDEKTNGHVIRLNNNERCILRMCGIPKEFILNKDGTQKDFIDITYPKPQPKTKQIWPKLNKLN